MKVLPIILFILPIIHFIVSIILIKSEQELVQKKQYYKKYSDTMKIRTKLRNDNYAATRQKVSLACETNTKLPFDIDFFPQNPKLIPIILFGAKMTAYYSRIILFATYYSQNYASIIHQGLFIIFH